MPRSPWIIKGRGGELEQLSVEAVILHTQHRLHLAQSFFNNQLDMCVQEESRKSDLEEENSRVEDWLDDYQMFWTETLQSLKKHMEGGE